MPSLSPILAPLDYEELPNGTPEIVHVSYDLWILRITLQFEDMQGMVYVDFDASEGFRVLDEGDLLEFWETRQEDEHYIYQVDSGGWFDLEDTREGFLLAQDEHTEYLIVGSNDCVGVISMDPPQVSVIEREES